MTSAAHINENAREAENELDVFECPLDGVSQIEASAGTGKTWNICALYVRLLLEKKLSAESILVVTFTRAATAMVPNWRVGAGRGITMRRAGARAVDSTDPNPALGRRAGGRWRT